MQLFRRYKKIWKETAGIQSFNGSLPSQFANYIKGTVTRELSTVAINS
jgi:hypothetical protein